MKYLLILILIFNCASEKEENRKILDQRDDYTEKDYENYCNTYYNHSSKKVYQFIGFAGRNVICVPYVDENGNHVEKKWSFE